MGICHLFGNVFCFSEMNAKTRLTTIPWLLRVFYSCCETSFHLIIRLWSTLQSPATQSSASNPRFPPLVFQHNFPKTYVPNILFLAITRWMQTQGLKLELMLSLPGEPITTKVSIRVIQHTIYRKLLYKHSGLIHLVVGSWPKWVWWNCEVSLTLIICPILFAWDTFVWVRCILRSEKETNILDNSSHEFPNALESGGERDWSFCMG